MNDKRLNLSVVVPVYNEEESVRHLCEKLHEVLSKQERSYEIVLVDDGSKDGTWEQLRKAGGEFPHLRLIRLRRNFGQTAAMSAGIHESRGEVIVTMDADLQNDPADIPLLMQRIDSGFDVVSGWRKDRKDEFARRRLPSMLANALISSVTGVRLHDYGCSLKAYRREVLDNVELYGDMHRFIPALASWGGCKVDEIVVRHYPRRFGTSKYGLSRTMKVILDLLTVSFLLRYSRSPIQIFGKLGLMVGVPGLLLMLFMVIANISGNLFGTQFAAGLLKRPFWVMTSFMLVFFGIQFVCMGILAEIQIRTYHESQGKPIYVIREMKDSTSV